MSVDSLIQTVRIVRTKFGPLMTDDECGLLCNEVAWRHRESGWGLSRKPNGKNTRLPNGEPIAHDILHHRPTNTLFDILQAAGAESMPQWADVGPPQSPDRTWVAPLDPASFGSPTQPVGPPPPPGPTLAELAAKLDALTALVEGLPLLTHNSRITAEGVQRMEAALVTGVPLRLRAKLIGEVTGTVGGPTR